MRVLFVLCWIAASGIAIAATSTCIDPDAGVVWRVRWTAMRGTAHIRRLERRTRGSVGWVDASAEPVEVRWDLHASDMAALCRNDPPLACDRTTATCAPTQQCNTLFGHCSSGACSTDTECEADEQCIMFFAAFLPTPPLRIPLGMIRERPPLARSPRVVVPSGGCTIYLRPFANGQPDQRKVAVVGDSLTQSLIDPAYAQRFPQGYVQGELNGLGLRAEVEGQSGRRWTTVGAGARLEAANATLLDELRGLSRTSRLRAVVIALGANDAGYIAFGADEPTRVARRAAVTSQLEAILDELERTKRCTVLITAPDAPAAYPGVAPARYAAEAQHINAVLRARVQTAAPGRLVLGDFAQHARDHHGGTPSWFISDDLHLTSAGRQAYTEEMVRGVLACP